MRKLIFGINTTLDGCCDHTKGIGDEEVHDYFTNLFSTADTLVYGRKTYELMVPYWPNVANDTSTPNDSSKRFANAFAAIDNIVVISRTLKTLEYSKARVLSTDLAGEISRLKNQKGKDILLGGVDVPSQLMKLDLIDEYHFVVQPLLAGAGRRLMEEIDLTKSMKLQLTESKKFQNGSIALRYVR